MSMDSIDKLNKTICTGCGLCHEKCPIKCISMVEDDEGFRIPYVNESECIKCGLCYKSCPATSASDTLFSVFERKYYSAIAEDDIILKSASSGGVFGVLAEYMILSGGYVCGCVYDDNMEAVHLLTNNKSDIERMYGSKYVQSKSEQCFDKIYELLTSGISVLYTGTACQISALRLFLQKEYDNLYFMEILCHGVPSPGLFRKYKKYLESKYKARITDIRFRDKRRDGWGSEHRTCIVYEKDGVRREIRPTLPSYFSSFFYGLSLREACYKCKYARLERVSDITIGDFWGSWQKYGKRFDEGISVIGVNTAKGRELVTHISDKFMFFDVLTEQEAIRSNDNFTHPVKKPMERNSFYRIKRYNGLWRKTYFSKTYRRKILSSVYGALIPAKIRFFIRKFL